ncbi:hypothetical protein ACFOHS_16905 [Jhaorihella thermophila]
MDFYSRMVAFLKVPLPLAALGNPVHAVPAVAQHRPDREHPLFGKRT